MMTVIHQDPYMQKIADEALRYVRTGEMFSDEVRDYDHDYLEDKTQEVLREIVEDYNDKDCSEQIAMLESIILLRYVSKDD